MDQDFINKKIYTFEDAEKKYSWAKIYVYTEELFSKSFYEAHKPLLNTIQSLVKKADYTYDEKYFIVFFMKSKFSSVTHLDIEHLNQLRLIYYKHTLSEYALELVMKTLKDNRQLFTEREQVKSYIYESICLANSKDTLENLITKTVVTALGLQSFMGTNLSEYKSEKLREFKQDKTPKVLPLIKQRLLFNMIR